MVTADCNCVSRLLVALISAVILPSSAIEPVVSSTSATRKRELPHFAVAEPFTVMFWNCEPIMPMNVVGTDAEPVTTTLEPPVAE